MAGEIILFLPGMLHWRHSSKKLGITGTVTDASGEVLIGVSVLIKGSGQGTVTDLDGNFSLAANIG